MNRSEFTAIYLDWLNNFASIQGFAGYYGLSESEAVRLINLAKEITMSNHPEN
jgi:hypothetical protein